MKHANNFPTEKGERSKKWVARLVPAAICVAVLATASGARAGWPQYGFDAAHTSFNPAENTLARGNAANLAFVWAGQVGPRPCSPPIVAGGIVYVGARGLIHAFAADDGSELWSSGSCGGFGRIRMSLGRHLFVADEKSGGGDFAAFNPLTGDLIWCFDEGTGVAPALDEEALYLPEGVLDAKTQSTGAFRWEFEPPPFSPIVSPPAIGNGVVYATGDNFVFALNRATGRQIWNRPLNQQPHLSSPSVSGSVVYVGGRGLFALSASDGHIIWSRPDAGVNVTTPAIAYGKVFVNSQGDNFGLAAFDANTGALLWRKRMTGESSATVSVANRVVYEIAESGALMMFNSNTGAFLGSIADPGGRPFDSSPGMQAAVTNGTVYVPTASPSLSNRVDAFRVGE
jgi:outer membrane protein assembly factor BamB